MSPDNTLGLLYLASPTLPIGSFAYSQGLEKAIDDEIVVNKDSLKRWCLDMMSLGLAKLDLPLISRIYTAVVEGASSQTEKLNELVFASRETQELYLEERNLGQSLKRLVRTQSLAPPKFTMPNQPSFLVCYVAAGISLELAESQIKTAFLWSWLENQTAVASKAVPIGQSDAQEILLSCRKVIQELVQYDHQIITGSMPGQVMLSALHETQYSRLFRS